MTQLAVLRSRLQSLRTARAAVRWGTACAQLAAGVLIACGLAWALDVMMHWDRTSRGVILLAWLAAVIAMAYRWLWPLLIRGETVEHLALWVERQHRLDGDLISALQFEKPEAAGWGSPRLAHAVIDYVADFSRGLNVFEGFSWRPLPQRLLLLGGIGGAAVALCLAQPTSAAVFWNRFWLGSARYPTRTVLEKLTINGRELAPHHDGRLTLAVPQDAELSLAVQLQGEIPTEASAVVRGLRTGERGQWLLASSTSGLFTFTQPHLAENLRLWIRAGDAQSDPVEIAVVPLPIVDVRWTVEPPAYAKSKAVTTIPPGTRSFSVLQGSRLQAEIECSNKSLKSAAIAIDGQSGPPARQGGSRFSPAVEENRRLSSRGARGLRILHPRLDVVQQPLTYELQIVDADGLSPSPPITGEIRLQTDRPPRVTAAAISRKVLPEAQPRLSYAATDDFALGEVRLEWDVIPENGPRRQDRRVIREAGGDGDAVRGETTLDLRPLGLMPGDEVRIAIVADDNRGDFPAQTGRSEPIVLEVTDKNGILESLLEIDQQSAKQLDAIIEKELGIGGTGK